MSSTIDDDKLQIRCPGCGQRFKVEQDLRNRIVECGVCQHRFHISDDVIVRVKKFYPGEKRYHGLTRYQRIPITTSVSVSMPASEIYESHTPAPYYSPLPPQRIIAGFIGAIAILSVALLMIFGTNHGGPLDGLGLTRNLVLCGFTAAIGFSLLMYANPNTRVPAAIIGGCLAIALVSLPFFIKIPTTIGDEYGDIQVVGMGKSTQSDEPTSEEAALHAKRELMGLRPLKQELERLNDLGDTRHAYGLHLIGLQESNRIAVRDYMFRVTSADPSSHIYPREDDKYLFVITGLDMNLERFAALAAPLGEVRSIMPELNVAEVMVNNDIFIEPPSDKLINRDDPDFYELNLGELNSIDVQRVQRATLRITEAEPRLFRADIAQRLRELLDESGINFHGTIARALIKWDDDPQAAAQIAAKTAVRLHQSGFTPAGELVSLALNAPSQDFIAMLTGLWRENTLVWESYCIRVGSAIEPTMIKEFESADGSIKQSATRILSKIGGEQTVRTLQNALASADPELSVIIQRALDRIAAHDSPDHSD